VSQRKRAAFTLVELLVVIGIIAVLISVLLPVLSKVQGRGRDLKCQSNIRQLCVALRGYAEENKGTFPYGFTWNFTNKPLNQATTAADADEGPGNNGNFISWASAVSKWMMKGKMSSKFENDDTQFSPALQCPEASMSYPHIVGYVVNTLVCVAPSYELDSAAPPNALRRPAQTSNLLKDTALLWDTSVTSGLENNVGGLIGFDIDEEKFVDSAHPSHRFYSLNDPYGKLPPGNYGQNKPVKLDIPGYPYKNIDPPESVRWPYQGNVRFRHQSNTACNAGFADGHVEAWVGKFNPDKTVMVSGIIPQHTALRRYFMTKIPSGVVYTIP